MSPAAGTQLSRSAYYYYYLPAGVGPLSFQHLGPTLERAVLECLEFGPDSNDFCHASLTARHELHTWPRRPAARGPRLWDETFANKGT